MKKFVKEQKTYEELESMIDDLRARIEAQTISNGLLNTRLDEVTETIDFNMPMDRQMQETPHQAPVVNPRYDFWMIESSDLVTMTILGGKVEKNGIICEAPTTLFNTLEASKTYYAYVELGVGTANADADVYPSATGTINITYTTPLTPGPHLYFIGTFQTDGDSKVIQTSIEQYYSGGRLIDNYRHGDSDNSGAPAIPHGNTIETAGLLGPNSQDMLGNIGALQLANMYGLGEQFPDADGYARIPVAIKDGNLMAALRWMFPDASQVGITGVITPDPTNYQCSLEMFYAMGALEATYRQQIYAFEDPTRSLCASYPLSLVTGYFLVNWGNGAYNQLIYATLEDIADSLVGSGGPWEMDDKKPWFDTVIHSYLDFADLSGGGDATGLNTDHDTRYWVRGHNFNQNAGESIGVSSDVPDISDSTLAISLSKYSLYHYTASDNQDLKWDSHTLYGDWTCTSDLKITDTLEVDSVSDVDILPPAAYVVGGLVINKGIKTNSTGDFDAAVPSIDADGGVKVQKTLYCVNGDIRVVTGKSFIVNGLPVVTDRGAAVSNAAAISAISAADGSDHIDRTAFNTALATLVTEINALKDQFNTLLYRARDTTGHGLIYT